MSVNRYDRVDAPDWATAPFEKTSEGFIRGRACVTNIGVFRYMLADGTMEYELRHPDDVFDTESMASLRLKPVTNNHPSELVTADNIGQYQVGNLGDNPAAWDNLHLTVDMVIQNRQAIEDVMAGKQELSCGYTADLVDESGVWLGMPYTKRQKNIRYNHVAIVDRARAGEAARIRLDSGDAVMIDTATTVADNISNGEEEPMADLKKVKLDGVEYDAEAPVIAELNKITLKADALGKDLEAAVVAKSTIEAERDSLKERLDASDKRIVVLEAERVDEAAIEARVARRLQVLDTAKRAEVEVKQDMDEKAIVLAVIGKVFPEAKLDGRDEAYIGARFECAVETLDARDAAAGNASVVLAGGAEVHGDSVEDSAKARAKMLADREAQWKAK